MLNRFLPYEKNRAAAAMGFGLASSSERRRPHAKDYLKTVAPFDCTNCRGEQHSAKVYTNMNNKKVHARKRFHQVHASASVLYRGGFQIIKTYMTANEFQVY